METGERIKKLRIRKGLSQAQLARAVGVTPAAVGNYEQGVSFPKEKVLKKLFGALGCTPNELFSEEELYSAEDYEHLKLYASLDENGKQAVNECTERELSRASAVRVAARGGSSEIMLKKRSEKSVFDADDYNSRGKK